MRRRHCIYNFLFFTHFLLVAGTSAAQSFSTRLYTITDGLPDNYIFSISQDSFGYLWIGTANGLSRFDGKRFKNYGIANGLPSLQVDRVYEDSKHRLWIGTRRGMAEMKGDSCFVYPVNDKLQVRFVCGFMEQENGDLWALTDKGIYRLGTKQWEKLSLYPGFDNKQVASIASTKNGWFINYENRHVIWKKPDNQYQVLASQNTSSPYFNTLRQYKDSVFISTYSGLYTLEGDRLKSLYSDSLSGKFIYGFFIDSKKRFWFTTKKEGIFIIDGAKKNDPFDRIPLYFNLVSNFFEDKEKNIWAACLTGLLKISEKPYQSCPLPGYNTLQNLRNIIALPENKLLVSGSSGKLALLQAALIPGNKVHLSETKSFKLDQDDFIDFHAFDELNRLWMVSRNGRLYRLDQQGLQDFSFLLHRNHQVSLRHLQYNMVTKQLLVCADSVLLVGDETRLDTLFEKGSSRFISIPTRSHILQDGSILVQTSNNGLFRIDRNNGFEYLNEKLKIPDDGSGFMFRNDNYNQTWIAYQGKGIARFHSLPDGKVALVDHITEKQGLPDNAVSDFQFDPAGLLWCNSKKGLAVLQKMNNGNWLAEKIEPGDDLKTADLFFSKLAITPDRNIWINSSDRVLLWRGKKNLTAQVIPETVIEEIQLYNKSTDWSRIADSVSGYRQFPFNPVLKYSQNSFSISFNAVQFTHDAVTEFQYQLEPIDEQWSYPVTNNAVSFYQLSPGTYHFRVKARLRGSGWGEPAEFGFRIEKPFWETWWFRILVLVLASSLLITIYRSRLNQWRRKTAMETQIHELEMNALKAQMNPHFIYNALNSIQSLIINERPKEASGYISKFAKLLRQVLENAEKDLIPLTKELYSLQLYVDLEKLRMNMEVDYEVSVDEMVQPDQTRVPPLILQPFVENALWHGLSRKQGNKKISLRLFTETNWIICEISDNGVGRKNAVDSYSQFPEGHLSKAVRITRQRLFDFNQSPGTEPVTYIDKEENGQASGTTVIIRISKRASF